MKTSAKALLLLILSMVGFVSCEKEKITDHSNQYTDAIKSVFGYGKTQSRYIYNSQGQIQESQSLYFCKRFTYHDGKLEKVEHASDASMFSSTWVQKSELMTSKTAKFDGYSVFHYNEAGKPNWIKYYSREKSGDRYISAYELIYEGEFIVRRNLYNSENVITQFTIYKYDNNGNVENEKDYSYYGGKDSQPTLISENNYEYDNMLNPYRVFKDLGIPGLYTNNNNVIESNSIFYQMIEGRTNVENQQTSYEYNEKGYPVKVITPGSEYEYRYE